MITLRNDFHGTTANLRPSADGSISIRAYRAAMNKLCGMSGCTCGGIRGKQTADLFPVVGSDGIESYQVAK